MRLTVESVSQSVIWVDSTTCSWVEGSCRRYLNCHILISEHEHPTERGREKWWWWSQLCRKESVGHFRLRITTTTTIIIIITISIIIIIALNNHACDSTTRHFHTLSLDSGIHLASRCDWVFSQLEIVYAFIFGYECLCMSQQQRWRRRRTHKLNNNNYYLLHPRADDHAQRLFGRRTDQRVSYLTCRPLKLASFSADGQVSAEQPPDCMCR